MALNNSSESAPVVSSSQQSPLFENIAIVILTGLAFMLPLFAFSSPLFSFQFSRVFLFSVSIVIALALFIISVLKKGKISIPFHPFAASFLVVIAAYLLSAFFSSSPMLSLLGYGFETDTVAFIFLSFFYLFLVSVLFNTKEKIFYSYLFIFGSLFLVSLFHLARLIWGADTLSFGIFTNVFSSPVGKWNEVGIFFGLGVLLSLITLEMARLSRFFKNLLYIAFGLSLFFIVLVNFPLVWTVLGIFSLMFFVFLFASNWKGASEEKTVSSRRISWPSLIVLVLSIICVLGNGIVGNIVSSALQTTSFEVRPSWSATFDIAAKSLKQHALFGTGPNSFFSQWLLFKPAGVNNTTFWNTTFNYGIGIIPTSLVTMGMLGASSWILFLGLFIYVGFRSIFSKTHDEFSQYLITSSFLVSLYLWIIMVVYVPSITIIALTFFFTGLFLSVAIQENIVVLRTISFSKPLSSFISILISVFLLAVLVSYGYITIRHSLASAAFEKGVLAFRVEGSLNKAEAQTIKALQIGQNDAYYRTLSDLNRARLSEIASRTNASTESIRADFQNVFASALNSAQMAVNLDSLNYQNWLALGKIYQIAVAVGIEKEKAYELAKSAYVKALDRNPHSPELYLNLARLAVDNGNNKGAREYISQALAQKQNYTEAVFLLSQIEVSEGNLNAAITSVEKATLLAPNDISLYFQLGLLKYNKRDYKGAIVAFERAVTMNSLYANARYFLGLSYNHEGRVKDAVAQFEAVQATNPDNQEVKLILRNLKAGKEPFANATPPVDNQPEKRGTLPVDEGASQTEE